MSTHCLVATRKNGKFHSIYVHFDGYPSGVGAVLLQKYNTKPDVDALISAGNRSTIDGPLYNEKYSVNETLEDLVTDSKYIDYIYVFSNKTWSVISHGDINSIRKLK